MSQTRGNNHRAQYRLLDADIGLTFPTASVARVFRHVFGAFPCPPPSQCASLLEISRRENGSLYGVSEGRTLLAEPRSLTGLVTSVEREMVRRALATSPDLCLHAGAVSGPPGTLILPGRSGAGKTTVVLGLLQRGWIHLSDEIARIDPATSAVGAYPRALCVKEPLDAFRAVDHRHLLDLEDSVMAIDGVSFVSPATFSWQPVDARLPVSAVVFPVYAPASRSQLVPITRARAVSLLTAHVLNPGTARGDTIRPICRLVEQAECFALQSCALGDAIDLLEALEL